MSRIFGQWHFRVPTFPPEILKFGVNRQIIQFKLKCRKSKEISECIHNRPHHQGPKTTGIGQPMRLDKLLNFSIAICSLLTISPIVSESLPIVLEILSVLALRLSTATDVLPILADRVSITVDTSFTADEISPSVVERPSTLVGGLLIFDCNLPTTERPLSVAAEILPTMESPSTLSCVNPGYDCWLSASLFFFLSYCGNYHKA